MKKKKQESYFKKRKKKKIDICTQVEQCNDIKEIENFIFGTEEEDKNEKEELQKMKIEAIRLAVYNEKLNFEKMKLTSRNEALSNDNRQLKTKKRKLEIFNTNNIQLPKRDDKSMSEEMEMVTDDEDENILFSSSEQLNNIQLLNDKEQLKIDNERLITDNEQLKTGAIQLTNENKSLRRIIKSFTRVLRRYYSI